MNLKMKKKVKNVEIKDSEENSSENEDQSLDESENNFQPGKKRKISSKVDFNRKKIKPSRLTKQPTSEELNRLRESENLFNSNFFRLQIEEVLKEVVVKPKYVNQFEKWLVKFNEFITSLEDGEKFEISDLSWLADLNVEVPVILKPITTSGYFKFVKCDSAVVVGSHFFKCSLGPSLNVDIKIDMPKSMFYKDDYLNDRYHRKRALYLVRLASALRDSGLVEDIKYKLLTESNTKPVLTFLPSCKFNKNINVTLHVSVEGELFKLNRFSPSRNNVRENWRFKNADLENSLSTPTPLYNNAILVDLTYDLNNKVLFDSINDCENIKQGIILLKIWLKQRQIYKFSGFIMTMFVVYLIKMKRINNAMSSYQVIRNVWSALAASDWDKNGITMCTADESNQLPILQEFHTHFPVVFVDASGYNNICANVNLNIYNTVKHESQLAVDYLDNSNINGFIPLFMTPVDPFLKFDHILRIEWTKKLESIVMENVDENVKLDCGPDTFPIIQNYICDLLHKGLSERVSLITPKCLTHDELSWPIGSKLKKQNPLKRPIIIGLKLNPDHAFNSVDKGPEANMPEAEKFRQFWGTKSELRRFQDGSICETCVWETTATMAAKRLIVKKIIFYLFQVKLGIEEKLFYIADQFEVFLHNNRFQPANFDFGTGEEAALKVGLALNELSKNLRSLTDMPLEVNSAQGTSSVFSYTDPNPPLAYAPPSTNGYMFSGNYRLIPEEVKVDPKKRTQRTELYCPMHVPSLKVILHLTHSGKWPEDLKAFNCLKTAFYIQIAEALKHQCNLTVYPQKNHLDVLKDGFVFRLEISQQKEIALLKKIVDKEGMTKYRDTDESLSEEYKLIVLPQIRIALNGLHNQNQCFGPTASLAKRWIRSHLIDSSHFPDMCIDLLVASVFLRPEPFEVPIQPQVAFCRFLKMLKTNDWNTQMILLNFNDTLERDEIVEIETNFTASRSSLPPLYIVTPYENKKNSIYSKNAPSFQILARMQILATEALSQIQSIMFNNLSNNINPIFTPNLEGFDVKIHIKKNFNPLRHLNINQSLTQRAPEKLKLYEKNDKEFIPIVDFDPIQIYLENLRSSYDEFALFFHDTYGGSVIAVLWKPSCMDFKDFKTSNTNGRKLIKRDDKIGIITDIDSILEGFHVLGEGLVEDIENITNLTL